MPDDSQIDLLARVARSTRTSGEGHASILTLAAASYGARPIDEATVPTGFDLNAVALFEAIVEGAYLVAVADGVVDATERRTFERVVIEACGGVVAPSQISALVLDLATQVNEDGLEKRIAIVGAQAGRKREHAIEVLRIAALLAQTSEGVSAVERGVLVRLATASGLNEKDVDDAQADVLASLGIRSQASS